MSWNLEEALAYYRTQGAPADQNALKNLLLEIQQEQGGSIPSWILPTVAQSYGVPASFLAAIIRRFPSLRLAQTDSTHVLELCGGGACSKRGKLLEFVEKTYGKNPEKFTLRVMPCMHLCGQGPNLRWDGEVYCGADEALVRRLVEGASCPVSNAPADPKKSQKKEEKKQKKDEKKKKSDR